jgi:hypothetical protein
MTTEPTKAHSRRSGHIETHRGRLFTYVRESQWEDRVQLYVLAVGRRRWHGGRWEVPGVDERVREWLRELM